MSFQPTDDRIAAGLRGFGPLGILAMLVILAGNLVVVPLSAILVLLWRHLSGTPWHAIGFVRPRSRVATVAVGIRNVFKHLTASDILVFNGDVLAGTDLNAVVETHRRTKADATLHLVRVQDPRAFGCVPTDADGRVTAFLEKTEDPPTDQINAGCYVFRREVIEAIPEGRPVSVERETFPGLLASGARVSGHVDVAYWRDMGTPMDLVRGSADLVRGVAPSAALPGPTGESLVLEGARIDPTARVAGGTTVGRTVTIGKGARIEGAMLFDGAVIEDEARVVRAVVGANARIEHGAVVYVWI